MSDKDHKNKIKICFAASSGGHLEQILMLRPLMSVYDSFLVTEETSYRSVPKVPCPVYLLPQVNRKEKGAVLTLIRIAFRSVHIFHKEKPDVVITTGVLAMIPLCLIAKLHRKKLVYIESFAKVTSPTETGKFLHRFADRFYVQWETMKKVYPNARFIGGIY